MKAEKAKKGGAALRKIGNVRAGFGHVSSIRMGSEYGPPDQVDDGMAEIAVHHGPKKKPSSEKGSIDHSSKTSRLHISSDEAKGFKIGDRVRVSLHKHSS